MNKKKIGIIVGVFALVVIIITAIVIAKMNSKKVIICEITNDTEITTENIKEKVWFNRKNILVSYKGNVTITYKNKEAYEEAKKNKREVKQIFNDSDLTEKYEDYRKNVKPLIKGENITYDIYIKEKEGFGYKCK